MQAEDSVLDRARRVAGSIAEQASELGELVGEQIGGLVRRVR